MRGEPLCADSLRTCRRSADVPPVPGTDRGRRALLIDNHDSFTFNIAHALAAAGARVLVRRPEELGPRSVAVLAPDALVLGPGPGGPRQAVVCADALAAARGRIPVLGICLGHQIIAQSFGAAVAPAAEPVHGKIAEVHHVGRDLYEGLDDPLRVARYHSLAVAAAPWPGDLARTAWTEDGTVMGIGVHGECTWGVQYHPESFLAQPCSPLFARFLAGVECTAVGHVEAVPAATPAAGGQRRIR